MGLVVNIAVLAFAGSIAVKLYVDVHSAIVTRKLFYELAWVRVILLWFRV